MELEAVVQEDQSVGPAREPKSRNVHHRRGSEAADDDGKECPQVQPLRGWSGRSSGSGLHLLLQVQHSQQLPT